MSPKGRQSHTERPKLSVSSLLPVSVQSAMIPSIADSPQVMKSSPLSPAKDASASRPVQTARNFDKRNKSLPKLKCFLPIVSLPVHMYVCVIPTSRSLDSEKVYYSISNWKYLDNIGSHLPTPLARCGMADSISHHATYPIQIVKKISMELKATTQERISSS
nr:uncharacterized protein LOC104101164 isoform X2 [Nicotiana tomentosiformis]